MDRCMSERMPVVGIGPYLDRCLHGPALAEMRALRVKRLDLERRRIDVAEACLSAPSSWTLRRTTSAVLCLSHGSLSMSLRSTSRGRGLMNSSSPLSRGMLDNTNFRRDVFQPGGEVDRPARLHTSRHSPYDCFTGGRRGSERQGFAATARTCVSVDGVGRL